tara:strand:- start:80 stop:319 length:240 start_codon:yes stop_codon:yes gene_type:complete
MQIEKCVQTLFLQQIQKIDRILFMSLIYCPDCNTKMPDASEECLICGHQDQINESVGASAIISMFIFLTIIIIAAARTS